MPVCGQSGRHMSNTFGAQSSGVRSASRSSPGIARAPSRVRHAPVECWIIFDIAGYESRLASRAADFVIELFERTLRAGERDDMRTGACKFESDRAADAARGAGDEGNAAGKRTWMRGIFRFGN